VTPKICVSILPKNNLEALNLIEKAEKAKADLIEVRFDCFETSRNLSELVRSTKIPLIATNKLQSERGFFIGTETQRRKILLDAAKNGFAYVDIDLSSPEPQKMVENLRHLGAKSIVSYHKYDGALTISEMTKVLEKEISSDADICKIVTTAKTIEDNLTTLNFISTMPSRVKLVCFCMGENGRISRLLSPMFGAFFTFASLEEGNETAKGQMAIEQMRAVYGLLGAK
jgi:3-dehydroquinate dehydratase type I